MSSRLLGFSPIGENPSNLLDIPEDEIWDVPLPPCGKDIKLASGGVGAEPPRSFRAVFVPRVIPAGGGGGIAPAVLVCRRSRFYLFRRISVFSKGGQDEVFHAFDSQDSHSSSR